MIIRLSINVKKLDKARFIEGKSGALYADMVMMENREPDRFGNEFVILESLSKEERDAGKKGAILGNGRIIADGRPKSHFENKADVPKVESPKPESDDEQIPF